MIKLTLETQAKMLEGKSFVGDLLDDDCDPWEKDSDQKLILMQDLGNGIYECFANIRYSGMDLQPIGFLIPEKKLLAFPRSDLSVETDSYGNSLLSLSEENRTYLNGKFSAYMLRQLTEILFDEDGNPYEEELASMPGGIYDPVPTELMIHLAVGGLFHLEMIKESPKSFAEWIPKNFTNLEMARIYASASVSGKSIVDIVKKIHLLPESAVRFMFLGQESSVLYQMLKTVSTEELVQEMKMLSAVYRSAKEVLNKASQEEMKRIQSIYTVISDTCTKFPGKTVKIESKLFGNFYRESGQSMLKKLSPKGISITNTNNKAKLLAWDDIQTVKIGNKIIFRG